MSVTHSPDPDSEELQSQQQQQGLWPRKEFAGEGVLAGARQLLEWPQLGTGLCHAWGRAALGGDRLAPAFGATQLCPPWLGSPRPRAEPCPRALSPAWC